MAFAASHADDQTSPVPDGAKVEKLADGFKFTEGPTSDSEGNVYFTDQPNNRIMCWSIEGKLTTFMQPGGRANGLCFDSIGRLWACADEKNELWRIEVASKNVTVIASKFDGKPLNGPNDVWVRPDGGVYFSDPFFKRSYWTRGGQEQDERAIYFLAASGGELKRVTSGLRLPNGLVGTPDGKTLFVTDPGQSKTFVYDIQSDGTLTNQRLFCEYGGDGMTLDVSGNLYIAGKGVSVFGKDGKLITKIEVPEPWSANVCFGGTEGRTLFITASKGLYAIKLNVKGAARQ